MVSPYITFHGNCRETMSFYQIAFQSEDPNILPYGNYVPEGVLSPRPRSRHSIATFMLHLQTNTACAGISSRRKRQV